jgi:hypothetical protein
MALRIDGNYWNSHLMSQDGKLKVPSCDMIGTEVSPHTEAAREWNLAA